MKTKILIDTSCGISRREAESLGYEMIALPFLLDDIEYDEDKLTKDEFYDVLKASKEIHTSSASVSKIESTFDKLLKDYDRILYFPITSGLSSSYDTAIALAEKDEYRDRVIVVDHRTISVIERYLLEDVKRLIDEGIDPLKIKEIVEANAVNNRVYIIVDTLEYLKKGGRISAVSAALGNILNVKPILFSNGGKFEVVRKARGFKAAEEELMALVKNDFKEFYHDDNIEGYGLGVAYTKCLDEAMSFKDKMEKEFATKFVMDELSTVIGCHIGAGAIATAMCKRINVH